MSHTEFIDPRDDLEGFLTSYEALPGTKGRFSWKKAWNHLKTINHHKRLVLEGCFRLGMYKQGLLHDMSKYHPVEFMAGCRYFQGDKSPNNVERQQEGASRAWLHHKGRNKHHLEYWVDYTLDPDIPFGGMKMPVKYVVEMYVDRVAACKNYMKDNYTDAAALEYYQKGKAKMLLHRDTAALLEFMLEMLANEGEKKTEDFIRRNILHNKK
ncbi:MAG: DUF5662 family protein [Lachnospiraceae bacterium]|nr:DUF5662 family protein [Lachnospiraceae bacterium]